MGSSEAELRHLVRDLGVEPYFLGTFDKTFPGFVHKDKMCCAIVNTALRASGGVHWLALGWYPAAATFYLFDPYGFSDDKLAQIYQFEYEALLRRSALSSTPDRCLTLVKSTQTVQGPHSAACGLFCCLFLYAFVRWPDHPLDRNPAMDLVQGVPNARLEDPRCQERLLRNQRNLYRFLAQHSAYFREHARQIMSDTDFNKAKQT